MMKRTAVLSAVALLPAFLFAAAPLKYVAHRGEEAYAPEGSLPAYRLAARHGCDIVKFDLQETKDGQIVLSHDPTLKRTMGWDVKIRQMTLSEIREKGRFMPQGGYTNETIVTLAEALQVTRTVPEFWIDFKHFTTSFADRVIQTFAEAGIGEERIMSATFVYRSLDYLYKAHPKVRRVAHIAPTVTTDELVRDKAARHLDGVNVPYKTFSPEDVRRLKEAGYWVAMHFVDDPDVADRYRGLADAVVTQAKANCLRRVVTVTPERSDEAFANPLKGFRVDLDRTGMRHEFAGVACKYVYWNELEAEAGDDVAKIRAASDRLFAPLKGTHVKVVPRVILKWGLDGFKGAKAKYYFPKDLAENVWEGEAFERRLVRMIEKLGAAWDDDPRIAWIQMGLVGSWGEHHNPHPSPRLQKLMGDAFVRAFRTKRVLVRSGEDFTDFDFGYYWDSWAHVQQWGETCSGRQAAPPMLRRIERGLYRLAPIEGEVAYDWGRLAEQPGLSPNDTLSTPRHLDFLEMTIRKMHGTALGWISCYQATNAAIRAGADHIQKTLGYRFEIPEASWSAVVRRGSSLVAGFKVRNVGSAPFYYDWPVVLSMVDASGKVVWQDRFKTDVRTWMPGDRWNEEKKAYDAPPSTTAVAGVFSIPPDLEPGRYQLALAILDPQDSQPAVRLAVRARLPDGRHPVGEILVH